MYMKEIPVSNNVAFRRTSMNASVDCTPLLRERTSGRQHENSIVETH